MYVDNVIIIYVDAVIIIYYYNMFVRFDKLKLNLINPKYIITLIIAQYNILHTISL